MNEGATIIEQWRVEEKKPSDRWTMIASSRHQAKARTFFEENCRDVRKSKNAYRLIHEVSMVSQTSEVLEEREAGL